MGGNDASNRQMKLFCWIKHKKASNKKPKKKTDNEVISFRNATFFVILQSIF
jgi:hypothetical protein